MSYKDKEEEKRKKKEWCVNNPDKVKAMRERYNERRRQLRLSDPEYLHKESVKRRMSRLKMTEEELAAYDAMRVEERKKYQRVWAKKHSEGRHQRIKERMEKDPEYAEKMRETWKRNNEKRLAKRKTETPEERERRLQRNREQNIKKAREKALMQQLSPIIKTIVKKEQKPKESKPKYDPKTNPNFKKPGRILAGFKWNRY